MKRGIPKKFVKVREGEWQHPKQEQYYYLKCCDCGLIHRLEFRLHRNRLQLRGWRVEKKKREIPG